MGEIGRSNLARLTVLMPFIGYLIFFNPSFDAFFESNLYDLSEQKNQFVGQLHSQRLRFLYFGLLSLGVGTLLYTLLSPSGPKKNKGLLAYVNEMMELGSETLVIERFEETLLRFRGTNRKSEQQSPFSGRQNPSFPNNASRHLHDLISRILRSLPNGSLPSNLRTEHPGTMFQGSRYIIHFSEGYLYTSDVIGLMDSGITSDQNLFLTLCQQSKDFEREVFISDYYASNYSNFPLRVMIAAFFSFGLFLLAIPTITTSLLVLTWP